MDINLIDNFKTKILLRKIIQCQACRIEKIRKHFLFLKLRFILNACILDDFDLCGGNRILDNERYVIKYEIYNYTCITTLKEASFLQVV